MDVHDGDSPTEPAAGRRGDDPTRAVADRTRLVREHLDLVARVVHRVAAGYPRHVDREELWAAGALGLVEAARRYAPAMAVPFDRYATIRIRGAILDSTRSRDWASRSVRRHFREVEEASAQFAERVGRLPDREELAAALGVSPTVVDAIRERSARSMLLYLDHDGTGDGPPLRETIIDQGRFADPADVAEHRELLDTLHRAVDALAEPHRDVVRRYYLAGEQLTRIADELGVTQARVSQIRSEAIITIRSWLRTIYQGVPEVADSTPGARARLAYLAQLSQQSIRRGASAPADADRSAAAS